MDETHSENTDDTVLSSNLMPVVTVFSFLVFISLFLIVYIIIVFYSQVNETTCITVYIVCSVVFVIFYFYLFYIEKNNNFDIILLCALKLTLLTALAELFLGNELVKINKVYLGWVTVYKSVTWFFFFLLTSTLLKTKQIMDNRRRRRTPGFALL